ncbi:MAG: patatin-like phospholipase family protein [Deltaproteobacteria bacterium]|nr:patatin-like phospholipase family protein [Deltaproteobacteria bacterium]
MRKISNDLDSTVLHEYQQKPYFNSLGLVLSGGGVRAAYQAGFLKAVSENLEDNSIRVITSSSVGSLNAYVLALSLSAGLKFALDTLVNLWLERNFENTFSGVKLFSFIKSFIYAFKLRNIRDIPTPKASILDPSPLKKLLNDMTKTSGHIRTSDEKLTAIGIMTTKVGRGIKKGVLFAQTTESVQKRFRESKIFDTVFVNNITVEHCLASAALPTIMPPIVLGEDNENVMYLDGGFVQNVPIDPAVRLGANEVFVIDVSGRKFWKEALNLPQDSKPSWEIVDTNYSDCLSPQKMIREEVDFPLGKLLKDIISKNKLRDLGPIFPLFKLLENKLGNDLAFEAATYVTINSEFIKELIKLGYERGKTHLKKFHKFRPCQATC